ncbi:MAG TPA: sodium-dependent transporter [Pseudomonadales bacterium]|nr:sodium-dependent transporter [Pseudomonadales bacterium]
MKRQTSSDQGMWRRQITFLLASSGSAIGLGNIWKFPYIAGENGGGAFILMYLLCIFLVGVPIYMAETVVGHETRRNPVSAMAILAHKAHASQQWRWVGGVACLIGIIVLSYFTVVAGWGLHYLVNAFDGAFQNESSVAVRAIFIDLLSDPVAMVRYQSLFLAVVMVVVGLGVRAGLGVANHIMVPLMLLMLGVLIAYSHSLGDMAAAIDFMFTFNIDALNWNSFLVALGHAFFSLSIGMGAMMAYGAYMPKRTSIPTMVFAVASIDVLFALFAGLAIFPIVFASGLAAGEGPGLMFVSLPVAFGNMHYGSFMGAVFFSLVLIAALSSSVALLEPAVAWLNERRGVPRPIAVLLLGVLVWLMSLMSMFSFNALQDVRVVANLTIFEALDTLSANILLPGVGFALAYFVGWRMDVKKFEHRRFFGLWIWLLRYVTAPAVLLIFITTLIQHAM